MVSAETARRVKLSSHDKPVDRNRRRQSRDGVRGRAVQPQRAAHRRLPHVKGTSKDGTSRRTKLTFTALHEHNPGAVRETKHDEKRPEDDAVRVLLGRLRRVRPARRLTRSDEGLRGARGGARREEPLAGRDVLLARRGAEEGAWYGRGGEMRACSRCEAEGGRHRAGRSGLLFFVLFSDDVAGGLRVVCRWDMQATCGCQAGRVGETG